MARPAEQGRSDGKHGDGKPVGIAFPLGPRNGRSTYGRRPPVDNRVGVRVPNDEDLQRAFRHLRGVFQAEEGSAQARERDVLVTRIEDYENEHHGFGPVGKKP